LNIIYGFVTENFWSEKNPSLLDNRICMCLFCIKSHQPMERSSRTSIAILTLSVILPASLSQALPQDSLLPPAYLEAQSNYDTQVPLYWFAPGLDPTELGYDDGTHEYSAYVHKQWNQNRVAIRFSVPQYLPLVCRADACGDLRN
jgi:hypothetical protein